ncbi:FAD-binding domain-containing protein [Xylariomycetidae sp. FL0641]|nr:FAD-binding domain-containing protein [Xylariomycetidae sp. FL0641]
MTVSGAIDAVKALSSDLVLPPGSEGYDEIIKSYFSELERELKPACFLAPNSAAQVSDIVRAIKDHAEPSSIAICGSGQQATPGVANVRDGITIHLCNVRGIKLDKDRNVISVSAGEQMGKVYEALVAEGLGVVGNRHSGGGIGGDALQAGLSYFSYAHGFVCDNVINYEVVLANGDIVNANEQSNSDLWRALRGGGNNFGIVTRFDLTVFEQGKLWGGKVFYFQPSFSEQIQGLVDYLSHPSPDVDVHICLSLGYAPMIGSVMAMNDVFCTRPEKPKALGRFVEMQPQVDQMNTLRVASLKDFTDEAFAGAASNRVVKMSTTVKADVAILEYAVQTFSSSLEELKGTENLLFSITFEPLPVSLMEQSVARGGNVLGLEPSGGPLVVVMLYTSWDKPVDDQKVYSVSKSAIEAIESEAKRTNVFAAYKYLKYSFNHQDPFSSYGPESKEHLQAVSAKYDPQGFFQVSGAAPFKLT